MKREEKIKLAKRLQKIRDKKEGFKIVKVKVK